MALQVSGERELGQFQVPGGAIVVRLAILNGKSRVDIRRYFSNDDVELAPTHKGINLSPSQVIKLVEILKEVKE